MRVAWKAATRQPRWDTQHATRTTPLSLSAGHDQRPPSVFHGHGWHQRPARHQAASRNTERVGLGRMGARRARSCSFGLLGLALLAKAARPGSFDSRHSASYPGEAEAAGSASADWPAARILYPGL